VERADLGPVEGYQQRLLAFPDEAVDNPGHRVGDEDAVVVAEPPGALDAALGGGVAGEAPADGTEGGAPDVSGGFDQIGQRFGLALA
jgi:hypothetical protein